LFAEEAVAAWEDEGGAPGHMGGRPAAEAKAELSDKESEPMEVVAMNIRPLYDRIVVKRIEKSEQRQGGLFIPDSAKEKPQEGEVVAVGNGKRLEDGKLVPLDVQAGDRILFGKYSGSEIKVDAEEFLIMREDDVLGVIEDDSTKVTT
jgi:chaperonin GroES